MKISVCHALNKDSCKQHNIFREPVLMSYKEAVALVDKAVYDRDHADYSAKPSNVHFNRINKALVHLDSTNQGFVNLTLNYANSKLTWDIGAALLLNDRLFKSFARRCAIKSYSSVYVIDKARALETLALDRKRVLLPNGFLIVEAAPDLIKDGGKDYGTAFLYSSHDKVLASIPFRNENIRNLYDLKLLAKYYLENDPKLDC